MKIGLVVCGPDVAYGPLALLEGEFEEKLRKAARLGCDGVELMVRDPAALDWTALKTALASVGLEVPQVVTGELYGADGLCLVTADEHLYRRAEERLQAVIDLAAALGAMVNLGRVRGRLDLLGLPAEASRQAWEIAVERLERTMRYAAGRGVRITLEPLNRYETDFILTAAEGRRLIDDLGCENAGLMLDVFHMNIEEASFREGFQAAGNRLWHVHVADSNRRYPGSAHLDFGSVFAALEEMGYQGYLSAELLPWPDPDTAARKTMEFLRRYRHAAG